MGTHFNTVYFHYNAGSQPLIRIENESIRSREQQKLLFELTLPVELGIN